MALIKCPECNNEVSDTAVMCPFCGYNVKEHFYKIKVSTKKLHIKGKVIKNLKFIIPIIFAVLIITIVCFTIYRTYHVVDIVAGDVISLNSKLENKKVRVSGYIYHAGIPSYNEEYGYVTYYLKLSNNEEIQVNYSGDDAKDISFNTYDILEADGIVSDVYNVGNTILQIDCKRLHKIGVHN